MYLSPAGEKEMRFYDPHTREKLLTHRETREGKLQVEQALSQEQQAKSEAMAKAERLAAKLRSLGIAPEE